MSRPRKPKPGNRALPRNSRCGQCHAKVVVIYDRDGRYLDTQARETREPHVCPTRDPR